jgi:hypothetical protein
MTCGAHLLAAKPPCAAPLLARLVVSSYHRARDKNRVPTRTVRGALVRRRRNAVLLRCRTPCLTPLLLHVQVVTSSPEPSSVARAPLPKRCLRRRLLCASWSNRHRQDQGRARPRCAIIRQLIGATQSFSTPVFFSCR